MEIPKWTAEEFERLVLDCKPKVAVFDCDGTLWSGDAGYGFMAWSLEQGLVSRSTSDWIDTRHRAYRAGHVSEPESAARWCRSMPACANRNCAPPPPSMRKSLCAQRFFPEMASLVAALRQAGVELWAVSSTNNWVVAEGVRDFGIPEEHILAAEVRVDDGIITSEILDVPTGEGKAAALKRIGLDHPDAVFGNSIHDLAMLEMARCAFPVNPSPALLEAAAKNGWGYFRPRV